MDNEIMFIVAIIVIVIGGGALWNYFKRKNDIAKGKHPQFDENDDENKF